MFYTALVQKEILNSFVIFSHEKDMVLDRHASTLWVCVRIVRLKGRLLPCNMSKERSVCRDVVASNMFYT